MKKALLYVRVSSQEQAEEGYSLDSQIREGQRYADKKGLTIVKSWSVSESAKAAGRKAFKELLEQARSDPSIQVIVFEKVDRMTRNFYDLVEIYDLADKYGKEIHFFKQGFIIDRHSKSNDKFNLDIQVVLAKNFITNLSEEVKKGMTAKAEQGEYPQKAPYGYINNKQTKLIEPDLRVASQVTEGFRLYSSGRFSIQEVINLTDIRSPGTGKSLTKGVMHHILKNPVYYGYFRWNGQILPGIHQPLTEKSTWDKVQEIMAGKVRYKPNKREFTFSRMLECARCGCAVVGEEHKGRYVYYHCTGNKGCEAKSIFARELDLEHRVAEELQKIKLTPSDIGAVKTALRNSLENEQAFSQKEIQKLTAEYNRKKNLLAKLYEDKLSGVITTEFWLDCHNQWSGELKTLSDKIDRFRVAKTEYYENGVLILELAQRAATLYLRANLEEKRQIQNIVYSNLKLDGKNLLFTYNKPFNLIAEGLDRLIKLPE